MTPSPQVVELAKTLGVLHLCLRYEDIGGIPCPQCTNNAKTLISMGYTRTPKDGLVALNRNELINTLREMNRAQTYSYENMADAIMGKFGTPKDGKTLVELDFDLVRTFFQDRWTYLENEVGASTTTLTIYRGLIEILQVVCEKFGSTHREGVDKCTCPTSGARTVKVTCTCPRCGGVVSESLPQVQTPCSHDDVKWPSKDNPELITPEGQYGWGKCHDAFMKIINEELPSIFDLRGIAPDATGNLTSEEFVRKNRNDEERPRVTVEEIKDLIYDFNLNGNDVPIRLAQAIHTLLEKRNEP